MNLAQLKIVGSFNSISGLTLTGSGSSFICYNMPAYGYADAGRTVTAILTGRSCLWFPASALQCIPWFTQVRTNSNMIIQSKFYIIILLHIKITTLATTIQFLISHDYFFFLGYWKSFILYYFKNCQQMSRLWYELYWSQFQILTVTLSVITKWHENILLEKQVL